MLKQNKLNYLIVVIPLFILLGMGLFFAHKAWKNYQYHSEISKTLTFANSLQKFENATIEEALCLAQEKDKPKTGVCSKLSKKVQNISENFHGPDVWKKKMIALKSDMFLGDLNNLEASLKREKFGPISSQYIDSVNLEAANTDVLRLVKLYESLTHVIHATQLESFLVSYHVTKKVPVSIQNIIFWDKIMQGAYLTDFKHIPSHPKLQKSLDTIANSDNFLNTQNILDEMRITILTRKMDLNDKGNVEWITLLQKKISDLESMKSTLYSALKQELEEKSSSSFSTMFVYLLFVLLALVGLMIIYKQARARKHERDVLLNLVERVNRLDADESDTEVLKHAQDGIHSNEYIYAYLDTRYQRIGEKYQQSQNEVELRSHFLSTLSHEIRTPLNGIIGFSKLLKDMGATPDQEEFLSLVSKSSNNLITIVNDILDLSKMNAEQMVIVNEPFDIFDMVETTVATFTQPTDQKDIELALFIDPFLKRHFLGDETKLGQILTNLIGNAVKFTEPYGKINVFVQMLRQTDHEAEIKFAVNDDGIGLSADQVKKIFTAFSQATNDTSRKFGGTGLGLAISYEMVELMGGKLEVESDLNQGSNFYFTLKLQKDKEQTGQLYPKFPGTTVGLALPVRSINRQLDSNMESYIKYLGAEFKYYYYDELFSDDVYVELPDIMIFDHHYARLKGELDQCLTLDTKNILLTNGVLYSRINPNKHHFKDIIYRPISLEKTVRILKHNLRTLEIEAPEDELDDLIPEIVEEPKHELENVDSFEGLHALVTDDNTVNRKLLKIILEKIGLTVSLAANGEEAVEVFKEEEFDIVFMDIQMPVMDGLSATQHILEFEKENGLDHTPIIALTANVASGDREYYIGEGMDDYATKPVEINTIKMLISMYTTEKSKKLI